jgi:dTDP-4-amino-4,6-dideoxygalactose transaminase
MEVKNIRLSKSCIGQEEIDAVTDVLKREYLGMGSDVYRFEAELTVFFGRNVTLVNTGTAALHLAMQGVGIHEGDEVLVQSLTYVACFQAIRATGATPVACEVYDDTLTLDLKDAESKISPRTKALMPIHYGGNPGNLDAIYEFAHKYNLRVIEDASHGFGSYYKGRKIGSFGDICCISMDGIKNITAGEGGMIITNDLNVKKIIKDARLLSVQNDTDSRFKGTRTWEFDVDQPGWRYHMSNIMAAIGYTQLAKFSRFRKVRQDLARLYQDLLRGIPQIKLMDCNYDDIVPHICVIRVPSEVREQLNITLNAQGVATGIHYRPNHLLSLFMNNQDNRTLVHTEEVYKQLITLPLHVDMSNGDVEYICSIIRNFFK